jgi:hypothetical protein
MVPAAQDEDNYAGNGAGVQKLNSACSRIRRIDKASPLGKGSKGESHRRVHILLALSVRECIYYKDLPVRGFLAGMAFISAVVARLLG